MIVCLPISLSACLNTPDNPPASLSLFLPFSLPSHFLAVQVGFDQANYTVVEREGVVFVRLVMVGRTTRPIQVQLSTVDGSAMGTNTCK